MVSTSFSQGSSPHSGLCACPPVHLLLAVTSPFLTLLFPWQTNLQVSFSLRPLNILLFPPWMFTWTDTTSTSDLFSNVTFLMKVSLILILKATISSSTTDKPYSTPCHYFTFASYIYHLQQNISYFFLDYKLHYYKDFCLCCVQVNSSGLEQCLEYRRSSINTC